MIENEVLVFKVLFEAFFEFCQAVRMATILVS